MKELYRPHEFKELEMQLAELEGRQFELAKEKEEAAGQGDRSENASYDYAVKQIATDGNNINRLQRIINDSMNIKDPENAYLAEFLGSMFEIEDLDGKIKFLTLSGAIDFTDTLPNGISGSDVYMNVNSDVGRMFLGAQKGDEILYPIGREGFGVYTVISIKKNTDALQKLLPKKEYKKIADYRKALLDDNQYSAIVSKRIQAAIDVVAGELKRLKQ